MIKKNRTYDPNKIKLLKISRIDSAKSIGLKVKKLSDWSCKINGVGV